MPYYLELDRLYPLSPTGRVIGEVEVEAPSQLVYILSDSGLSFGKWILALMNFVAISLLVSLETVKFC